MASLAWISELKEGDPVIIWTWGWAKYGYIETTVQKITPKGFVRAHNTLFYPNNGFARGDSGMRLLNPKDPDVQKSVDTYKKSCFITQVIRKMRNTSDIPYEQAVEIDRILSEKAEDEIDEKM